MRSFRDPPGTVIRPLPDWNIRQMAANSVAYVGVTLPNGLSCGLFNNAVPGNLLVLWDLNVTNLIIPPATVGQTEILGGFAAGAPSSVGSNDGIALYAAAGKLQGGVWIDSTFNFTGDESRIFALDQQAWQWPHDWPIAVITAGQSFVVELAGPVKNCAIGFTWEVVDQT